MNETFINSVEDMNWLFDVHLNGRGLDRRDFKSAMIRGNEDSPSSVDLYRAQDPTVFDSVISVHFN